MYIKYNKYARTKNNVLIHVLSKHIAQQKQRLTNIVFLQNRTLCIEFMSKNSHGPHNWIF